MSCDCQNKKYSKDYERIKELARKMSKMDQKPYFIYKKGDSFNFEPVYPVSNKVVEALEFVFEV